MNDYRNIHTSVNRTVECGIRYNYFELYTLLGAQEIDALRNMTAEREREREREREI